MALADTTADILVLFSTRFVRLFAYGSLSVILVLYLAALGLAGPQIGLLLTLTLVGDTCVSLWLTTHADRFGRRRTLIIGAVLMAAAGVVFALTGNFLLLLLAATVGVISPSGNEVGPFLSVEQAALSHVVSDRNRTRVFAWYTLAASLATASGSLVGGLLTGLLQHAQMTPVASYRVGIVVYAALGLVLLAIFSRLSPRIEAAPAADRVAEPRPAHRLGLGRSHGIVLRLSALFSLDAFGGGFVIQSMTAYWFHVRFGVSPSQLGGIFFGANLLAGCVQPTRPRWATWQGPYPGERRPG
jgi:MFS family permease